MVNLIESKDNGKIKNALKIAGSTSVRRKNGVFFAATSKVVLDILDAGFKANEIFCVESEYTKHKDKLEGENVYIVSPQVADKLSEGKTEDGMWAVFTMKDRDEAAVMTAEKILVLEDVQDPNNMGAILRTALGFGFENIVVTNKCADVFSRKVIRTSMTASVKVNVMVAENLPRFTQQLNDRGYTTVAACLQGAVPLGSVPVNRPFALYIGNEGNGLSDDVIESCSARVKIPMSDKIESLNAAVSAAVLMWELGGR